MKTKNAAPEAPGLQESRTRERILDVAERLFAERGLDRVSIRDLTAAAEVNLGAINYHFQSREKLVIAVFSRCMLPLTRARLEALDEVERACGKKSPSVTEILGAFIRPAVEMVLREDSRTRPRTLLMGRCIAESDPALQKWLRQEMEPLMKRFDGALQRALPDLAWEDVFWGMSFTFGSLNHLLMTAAQPFPGWLKIKTPVAVQVERLVGFAAAGFCARAGVVKQAI